MILEMNWTIIERDLLIAINLIDEPKDEELSEVLNWKNTQRLLKQIHQEKGRSNNLLDYRVQFIEACHLLKLNEKDIKQNPQY